MGTAIVITSGKGGTGKTACCAAIAQYLAFQGARTLCVDCDAALRNLDLTLGLAEGVLFDFMDVVEGRRTAAEAIAEHPSIPNLRFLAAPTELLPHDVDVQGFREMVESLKEEFDYILLDSPAGIGAGFRLAAGAADMAVIVATGDLASLRDGQRTAIELRAMGVQELRLLVNRVSPVAYKRIKRSIDEIIDTVGARLIGVISEDPRVAEAGNKEVPISTYGARRACAQFERVARRITGERVRLGKI